MSGHRCTCSQQFGSGGHSNYCALLNGGTDLRDVPRRIDMTRWTPAKKAIHDAIQAVERTGADVLLTQAIMLLGEAQDRVADYVDAQEKR